MLFPQVRYVHRRKNQTEEQAKVVAALWGTEFNQFHAEPEFEKIKLPKTTYVYLMLKFIEELLEINIYTN